MPGQSFAQPGLWAAAPLACNAHASDAAVVATWLENPYWQYFCGETYLQTELPIDPFQPDALEKAHR